MDFTGREHGKTIIVAAYSPHILELPPQILELGPVIGVNKFAAEHRCDYWIGLDTGLNWDKWGRNKNPEWSAEPKFLKGLTVPKLMRRPNKDTESFVPEDAGIFFDQARGSEVPTVWKHELMWASSTALAAINLAIIMGASVVILYGVDFVGGGRADGTRYPKDNFWNIHESSINTMLRRFQNHVRVYKTHPASWLDCPLLKEGVYLMTEKTVDNSQEKTQKKPNPLNQVKPNETETKPNPFDSLKLNETPGFESDEKEPKKSQQAVVNKESAAELEKTKYTEMWEKDEYRQHSPAEGWVKWFLGAVNPEPNTVIADFGAGTGRSALRLRERGLKVALVDIAENCLDDSVKSQLLPEFLEFVEGCLWEAPKLPFTNAEGKADWFICCDVMEHIPESRVETVLDYLLNNSTHGGLLTISTVPDGCGKLIGEKLHLTVKPFEWWLDLLQKRWRVNPVSMMNNQFTVMVYPRG